MRRRALAAVVVGFAAAGAAAAAKLLAVGDGSVVATPPVTIVDVAGAGGSGAALLTNTTASPIQVALTDDVSCDPDIGVALAGGSPFTLPANGMQTIGFPCGAGQPPGLERCLVHATDQAGDPLADLLGVCENATSAGLVPSPASLPFGTVAVGDSETLPVALTNTGSAAIAKLFLQTDDLDGDYTIAAPCNPDASACDGAIAPIAPAGSATVLVTCAPRSVGAHVAHLSIATDANERLAAPIALGCTGGAPVAPVLAASPDTITVRDPVEVVGGQAHATVRLANAGTGTLQLTDIRVVDVVTGAAADWTVALGGTCSVLPCQLAAGAESDVAVTFDPSAIARRDASLLVSFHDTVDRTHSIPLVGTGQGATLEGLAPQALDFGQVPVGHTSTLVAAFANRGNRATVATLTAPAGMISTQPTVTVTPTAPATVPVTCAPTAAGTSDVTITAQSSDTVSTDPVAISASCAASAIPLFAEPSAIALGEVRTDAGAQVLTFQLASTGAPVTFAGPPTLDAMNLNLVVGTLSASTTPATLTVTLNPVAIGTFASHVLVADTAGDTLRIPIAGAVVTPMFAVPAAFDVGTFCVGQPTAAASVAAQVSGTATLEVSAPVLAAGDQSPFQLAFTAPTGYPASLGVNASATVAITPLRQSAAVTLADTLVWTTDDVGTPAQATAITAQFIDMGGAIAPPAIDFGKAAVHVFVSDGQRVVVQNCNAQALDLDPPTIKPPFSIDSPAFPSALAPNESATFSIGFHPTMLGTFVQTFTISSPQLPSQPLQVVLSGEGISTTPPGTDAGPGPSAPGETSFYACNCASGDPRGGWPLAVAALVVFRRRRRD